MSAMPPIATELIRFAELTRCATSGLMHRSKCGACTSAAPLRRGYAMFRSGISVSKSSSSLFGEFTRGEIGHITMSSDGNGASSSCGSGSGIRLARDAPRDLRHGHPSTGSTSEPRNPRIVAAELFLRTEPEQVPVEVTVDEILGWSAAELQLEARRASVHIDVVKIDREELLACGGDASIGGGAPFRRESVDIYGKVGIGKFLGHDASAFHSDDLADDTGRGGRIGIGFEHLDLQHLAPYSPEVSFLPVVSSH